MLRGIAIQCRFKCTVVVFIHSRNYRIISQRKLRVQISVNNRCRCFCLPVHIRKFNICDFTRHSHGIGRYGQRCIAVCFSGNRYEIKICVVDRQIELDIVFGIFNANVAILASCE